MVLSIRQEKTQKEWAALGASLGFPNVIDATATFGQTRPRLRPPEA